MLHFLLVVTSQGVPSEASMLENIPRLERILVNSLLFFASQHCIYVRRMAPPPAEGACFSRKALTDMCHTINLTSRAGYFQISSSPYDGVCFVDSPSGKT